jgi:chromosome partitioning protein
MTIITIANTKGGAGKSTLALHMAAAFQRQGLSASLIDLDTSQASAALFLKRRSARLNGTAGEPITVVSLPNKPADTLIARFEALVKTERDKGRRVILDTPAGGGRCLKTALDLSTLLVTPTNESLMDLAAIETAEGKPGPLGKHVRAARERREAARRPDLPWRLVLNRVSPLASRNAHKVGDRARELAGRWNFEIAGVLTERVLYRELFDEGLTLLDLFHPGADPAPLSAITARNELRDLLHKLSLPAVL